ncbi:DUF2628 domain-containing protein [Alkalihalobacillus sp. AL-G]|uniref:DUF2628 domain-containing protein n=1 Tax=Alkalihalobacillus sp. AL-G TaxID=2926399 RepID=UPI00272CC2C1|nr:DUF2628 domain-containing protein [Alkalihalobacillus sp. AL-G]WLD94434.1 DUF2628 domain-containing protein [Alkalihalobacillus sp. AL-G]
MVSKKKKHQVNFLDLDEETSEEVLEFVGRKADYYEKKWKRTSRWNSLFSWNWSPFFLGLFWFAFRKMNGYAYLLLGILAVADILSIIFLKQSMSRTNLAGIFVMIALTANGAYFDFVLKKVKRLKNLHPDREERLAVLRNQGGISWLHTMIFTLAIIIYSFSIIFIEEKVYYAYAVPKFSEAVELQQSGELDEAIEIYDDIENRNVPIPAIYYNKALIYGSKKEYKLALKNIEIYLKLVPEDEPGLELKEELLKAK